MTDELCLWCGSPATVWCDATIGAEAVSCVRDRIGNVKILLAGTNSHGELVLWTCDAPMCAEHATKVGIVFHDQPDTIDHCPYHMKHEERLRDIVMFIDESISKRRAIYAEARRSAMGAIS